jgi:hypothetical protein
VRRSLALATVLSLALLGPMPTARADSWRAATISETFSANRDWFVRVTPGKSVGDTFGFDGAPKGRFADAEWFQRNADGGYRIVARATLANPVAPVDTLVTDRGYLVTLDNWHNVGHGTVVAAYRPDGNQVIALRLIDLYTRREMEAFEMSTSSLWWRSESRQAYVRQDQVSIYVAGRKPGHELILEPESGRWQVCEPRNGRQQCRTTNEPRTWGAYQEPAGADAYLRNDLHALGRAGVRVGAVIGPQVQLQTTAPRLGPLAPPQDRRGWLAWIAARWSETLTVSDRPVVRLTARSVRVSARRLGMVG